MRNSRALIMVGFALLLAVAAVVVAASWLSGQNAGGSKVAVATADIGMGVRITPEMVHMVEWPASELPPGAIVDVKQIDTRVTRTTIGRGEPLMESKLAPPGTTGGLSAVVAEGKRAMTVRVNDVVGVAGFALPGNFVDILVNTQGEPGKNEATHDQAISKIVLERILVLAVAQEVGRDETRPRVVNAVTLEVRPDQAENLDLARSVGSLSLVLRNQIDPRPGVTAGATKLTLLGIPVPAAAPLPEAPAARALLPPLRVAVRSRTQCSGLVDGMRQSRECF